MLLFVTGNKDKQLQARMILDQYSIPFEGKDMTLQEIQTESLEDIALHKAQQAFKHFNKPLLVKDDGWYITALKGFPGVYMKYINDWFTTHDFLNLMKPYSNKEVIFKESVCYIDSKQQKVFINEVKARFVNKPVGKGVPSTTLVTFRSDGKTMAQCSNEGLHFLEKNQSIWHDFAKWYKKNADSP